MTKLMASILLLLSLMPVSVNAAEDCMMVDFPDHVELVCSGDGMSIPEGEQKQFQDRMKTAISAPQTAVNPAAEKSRPEVTGAAESVKPEEVVIVPKSLQIRLDRAAQTMERMRVQQKQRNSDPSLPTIKPLPASQD